MFPPPPAPLDWNDIGFKVRDGTYLVLLAILSH
jgi:hypothetical protein